MVLAPPRTEPDTQAAPARVPHALPIAAVVAFGAAVPVLAAWHYGTFGAARGDDWSYLRALFHWTETGHLNFNNWVSMTLLGQLVLAAPLAILKHRDTTALQLFTATLGLVGLLAVEWTVWTFTKRAGRAAFAALAVAAGPVWGILAVSFMTDVPAFAFAMLSMAVGVRALRDETPAVRYVVASVALGFVAFTIREYAGVPAAAVAIMATIQALRVGDRRVARVSIACGAIAAVGVIVFMWVWRQIPAGKPFDFSFPTHHAISTAVDKGGGLLRLTGLWLSPLLLLRGPVRAVQAAWRASRVLAVAAIVAVGGWLGVTGLRLPRLGFAGNYVVPDGALGQGVSTGYRPMLIPKSVFDLLVVIGTVGAVLLALLLVPPMVSAWSRLRTRQWHAPADSIALQFVALCAGGYALCYVVAALLGLPLYDRYVLPIIGFVAVLLMASPERATEVAPSPSRAPSWLRPAVAGIAFAVVASIGVLYTLDSASFDAVRWNVSEAAVHAGWRADTVAGNFEWVNYHARVPGSRLVKHPACVRVVIGLDAAGPNPAIVARGTYRPPLHHSVPVLAVRTQQPCTPSKR